MTTATLHYLAQDDTVFTSGLTNGIVNNTLTGVDLVIAGTVIAGNVAVISNGSADNSTITVSDTGLVAGQRFGIAADVGIPDITIINHGSVFGYEQAGLASFGGNTVFTNTGSVFGLVAGVRFTSTSTNGALDNSGTITGGNGVLIQGTGATITNSGTIMADGSLGSAGYGVFTTGASLLVYNSGTIGSNAPIPSIAIGGGTGNDVIYNSGTIVGDINLGDEVDFYTGIGDGVVMGFIFLEDGNDTAQLGNAGGEVVYGGFGDDTLRGGTGTDIMYGDGDNDDIRGRAGADELFGGAGNDTVRAGRGDDVLDGGSGDDFMRGGAGEDVIIGGLGEDTMYGNGGSDTFVFNTASESTNAGAAWDRIMDFTQGQDQIDLTAFNARFIGTGAYAANGNIAEVRIFEDPNGDTRVFVDVNADGTSDMRFYLVNVLGVTADDFIL